MNTLGILYASDIYLMKGRGRFLTSQRRAAHFHITKFLVGFSIWAITYTVNRGGFAQGGVKLHRA
jgi:hypothetical protein